MVLIRLYHGNSWDDPWLCNRMLCVISSLTIALISKGFCFYNCHQYIYVVIFIIDFIRLDYYFDVNDSLRSEKKTEIVETMTCKLVGFKEKEINK